MATREELEPESIWEEIFHARLSNLCNRTGDVRDGLAALLAATIGRTLTRCRRS